MAIVPGDFLTQAEELVRQADGLPDIPAREVLLRTAVSRSYYAVFHEALARARREGYGGAPMSYGSHEGLWKWWFSEERPVPQLAEDGNRLKEERTRADYRLSATFSVDGTKTIFEDARLAFEIIRDR